MKDGWTKRQGTSTNRDVEYGRGAEGGIYRDRETLAESESWRRDRGQTEAKASTEVGFVL